MMSEYLSELDEFLAYSLFRMKKSEYTKVKKNVSELIQSLEETMCDNNSDIFSETNLYIEEHEISDHIKEKFSFE